MKNIYSRALSCGPFVFSRVKDMLSTKGPFGGEKGQKGKAHEFKKGQDEIERDENNIQR